MAPTTVSHGPGRKNYPPTRPATLVTWGWVGRAAQLALKLNCRHESTPDSELCTHNYPSTEMFRRTNRQASQGTRGARSTGPDVVATPGRSRAAPSQLSLWPAANAAFNGFVLQRRRPWLAPGNGMAGKKRQPGREGDRASRPWMDGWMGGRE